MVGEVLSQHPFYLKSTFGKCKKPGNKHGNHKETIVLCTV